MPARLRRLLRRGRPRARAAAARHDRDPPRRRTACRRRSRARGSAGPASRGYDAPEAWVRDRGLAARGLPLPPGDGRRAGLLRRHGPPPDVPALSPDRVALVAALRRLPAAQRRAVVLHHVAGLSVQEVAAETGVPVGTVKARLSRGRAALAALLTEEPRDRPLATTRRRPRRPAVRPRRGPLPPLARRRDGRARAAGGAPGGPVRPAAAAPSWPLLAVTGRRAGRRRPAVPTGRTAALGRRDRPRRRRRGPGDRGRCSTPDDLRRPGRRLVARGRTERRPASRSCPPPAGPGACSRVGPATAPPVRRCATSTARRLALGRPGPALRRRADRADGARPAQSTRSSLRSAPAARVPAASRTTLGRRRLFGRSGPAGGAFVVERLGPVLSVVAVQPSRPDLDVGRRRRRGGRGARRRPRADAGRGPEPGAAHAAARRPRLPAGRPSRASRAVRPAPPSRPRPPRRPLTDLRADRRRTAQQAEPGSWRRTAHADEGPRPRPVRRRHRLPGATRRGPTTRAPTCVAAREAGGTDLVQQVARYRSAAAARDAVGRVPPGRRRAARRSRRAGPRGARRPHEVVGDRGGRGRRAPFVRRGHHLRRRCSGAYAYYAVQQRGRRRERPVGGARRGRRPRGRRRAAVRGGGGGPAHRPERATARRLPRGGPGRRPSVLQALHAAIPGPS